MEAERALLEGQTIVLVGAGGKMGCRITDNLRKTDLRVLYVETGERGIVQLASRGIEPVSQAMAVPQADMLVMAVPDILIGKISAGIVPAMKPGSMLMLLDPASAYLEQLPIRTDLGYFISHPCHPPVFSDETDPEARKDFFGGIKARQSIVSALMSGPEPDFSRGEALARIQYGPILRSHRITLEQMAILEPAMAETVASTLSTLLGQALEQAVKHGVPEEAARDFMLGHINVQLGIVLGNAGYNFSDACLTAIRYGRKRIIRDGWESVFEPDSVREQIDVMLHPERLESSGTA
jgi:hypothetical protein